MRTLSSSLTTAQRAGFVKALVKIVLTKGASSYTYDKARILPSKHDEELYSQTAEIILHNRDATLNDLSFKGYTGVISYGATTSAGNEYSATAPLYVVDQQFNSNPNELSCVLSLEGIPNVMARDEASANYIPESEDTKTVKTLVNAIVGATLAPFTHCKAFEVVWDAGYDTLADSYKPADSFRIYTGGKRLASLRRVLDYTGNVPRFEDDGKCHILKPVTSGSVFDSEYSLERDAHKFFAKAYRDTVPFPNKVVVRSRTDDDPYYSGEAQISTYGSLADNIKNTAFIEARLASDDQADDIAEALIAKAEMGCKKGQAEVPLNVGAEIFDYVQVTDSRQGDTRAGNLGYVHRRFGQDKWTMTFGFGNWFDMLKYRDMLKQLEIYTDSGNYFPILRVGQLYAYLDEIKDGPDLYIRQNYLHLDATGVYISENTLYAVRVPGEAQHNLWKQDTAPTEKEIGDFWLDTNYTPNKVMIWTGSAWVEATSAQLAEFGRATILRIWKSAALTADGLIVLDEVQEGTYGLVLYSNLQAGSLLLSKTIKDGKWYEESGVVMDATYGIALYGGQGINAFRTFATKDDYLAGTNVLCYVGTNGKLTINGPGSLRFYLNAFYGGCLGISDTSPYEFCILAMGGNPLLLETEIGSGADIWLDPDSNYVLPYADNDIRLGSSSKQFYGGYFASRLKIPVGTDMYD